MKLEDTIKKIEKACNWATLSPVGYLVMGAGSYWTVGQLHSLASTGDLKHLGWGVAAAAYAAAGGLIFRWHKNMRKKLRGQLEEQGYSEELVKPYLDTWCARNVARIACSDAGCSREFSQTLEEYNLPWTAILPIIGPIAKDEDLQKK